MNALRSEPRPLWRPEPAEMMRAVEILLASELHPDTRRVIREIEQELAKQ